MSTSYKYSFYLFCKLKDIYFPSEEPYDISYEIDWSDYCEFLASPEFLQDNKSEHDCICDYFYNKQQQHG